uniref:Putative ankyrin repeat protein n=1 Tax=Talaromyces marneffei PM1 TaxID=1077442 RepID=A0A093VPM2_TALMA
MSPHSIFNDYDTRKQDISKVSKETCDWLLETPEFEQWRDRSNLTESNGVFWLKGKPGSGKSTMMRHISHQLQKSHDSVLLEHFFNARGSGLEKTFLGLLRSLVFQLLNEIPEFCPTFILIYRKKNLNLGQWEWRQSELCNFLQSKLKSYERELTILVDALDECSFDEITSVVSFLEDLGLDAVQAKTNLRICLSSRPYPNVSMKKNLELTLDGNAKHDNDIKKYVETKLNTKIPNIRKIEKGILQKANGVFLWVVLVVEMINTAVDRGRVEEIQKTLDDIPSDLDDFFERVIFNGPEKNPETLLMFQLVLFSKKQLTPAELVFAVVARFHEGYLKPKSQFEMNDDMLEARIVDSSKGLIEVSRTEYSSRVQFIHQTVTDFFLRNRRLERHYPKLEPDAIAASHDRLRASCLNYIEKFPIDSQSHKDQSARELKAEYPFLEYSAMYLLDHAEAALQGHQFGIKNDGWLLSPDQFQTWKRILFAIEKPEYLHGDLNTGLIYILVLHEFHNLFEVALRGSDVDINTQGGIFNNALQLAVKKRDEISPKMLIEFGANVHINGGYFGTVLQAALALENYSLVSTIIEKGTDLNATGGVFGTVLQAAAARGNLQVLKSLLERSAEVNVDGGIYGSVLHAAIGSQKVEIFQQLLHAGADVNSHGGIYGSALDLDKISDKGPTMFDLNQPFFVALAVGTICLENGPAIVWAARSLENDQVKLLLENGADVNAASGPWKTDVHKVHQIDNVRGMSLKYELGMTALIWAARRGMRDMIELLMEHGADIEAHSSSGETALLAGSEAGHKEIVKFLIDRGANLSAKDSFGQTALYKAAANGHVDIMRLLLKHEDFHDTHFCSDHDVITCTNIKTIIVNGGISSVWSGKYNEFGMNHSIQCLVMNGGFLYAGPKMKNCGVYIEKLEINGGICYFDMEDLLELRIGRLEVNGGSFHLKLGDWSGHKIGSLELNNGHLSINAARGSMEFGSVIFLGGSFNCKSHKTPYVVQQVMLGSTLSDSSKSRCIADPVSGLPDIYMKRSDGQIKEYGTIQPGGQNIRMSIAPSPLYVAAQNGHLQAVQLLLESEANFDKESPVMNPLHVARQRGYNRIVGLLKDVGQERDEKKKEIRSTR